MWENTAAARVETRIADEANSQNGFSKIVVYIPCGWLCAEECSAVDLGLDILCSVRHTPHIQTARLCADGRRLLLVCSLSAAEDLGSWLNEVDECGLASCNLSGFVPKLFALTAHCNRDPVH